MPNTRPLASDPLRNFRFTVNIMFPQVGVNTPFNVIGFMQAQGLGIQIEPLTYREGGDNTTTRKMPGQADFNPITLTHGLFPWGWNAWYWMNEIFSVVQGGGPATLQGPANPPYIASSAAPDFRTVIYINVLEHPNNSVQNVPYPSGQASGNPNALTTVSFKLYSAWIMGLAYSDLDAGGNAVGIEQMSIAYEGFDVHWGDLARSQPLGW